MAEFKITQSDLIKESFIRYYLDQYANDGKDKPSDEVAELLAKEDYILKLTIEGLKKHPNSPEAPQGGTPRDYVMDMSSTDIIATNHYFTPMGATQDTDTYSWETNNSMRFSKVTDIPYDIANDLFLISTGTEQTDQNYQFILREDFLELPDAELEAKLIELFEKATVVIFKDEEVGGLAVTKKQMFRLDRAKSALIIDSPAVTGEIPVVLDVRKMPVNKRHIEVIRLRGQASPV